MVIQILKNESYKEEENIPKSATDRSTGKDIRATSDPEIKGEIHPDFPNSYKSIDYIQYRTNLFISVKKVMKIEDFGSTFTDYDVLGFPRSSISKYNLLLANSICLIDADYRGEILLRFKYIWQPEDLWSPTLGKIVGTPNVQKIYKQGDFICQLKATKIEDIQFILTDELDQTERSSGGFGSTDGKISVPQHIVDLYSKSSSGIKPPIKKYADSIKEK